MYVSQRSRQRGVAVAKHSAYPVRMTLILGMSKPEGIYLCVDYRTTDARTGNRLRDDVPKCLAPCGTCRWIEEQSL